MRVSELMSRSVKTIGAGESCLEAVTAMSRGGFRHLPVVDHDARLAGIVTDRDLRHRLFAPWVFRTLGTVSVESLFKDIKVREVMSSPVAAARPDDELATAAGLMLEKKVGSLPVVDDGRVVGIITETDLLRHIVKANAEAREIEDIIVSYP
jgi:acetoin utilization protein AcuB